MRKPGDVWVSIDGTSRYLDIEGKRMKRTGKKGKKLIVLACSVFVREVMTKYPSNSQVGFVIEAPRCNVTFRITVCLRALYQEESAEERGKLSTLFTWHLQVLKVM